MSKKPIKKMSHEQKVENKLSEIVNLLKLMVKTPETKLKEIIAVSGERFTDNGNGTVTDKKTGLIWAKDGSEESMSFEKAEKYCKDLSDKTGVQWRLPTVEELFSLVDYTKHDPAINPIFKSKSAYYWTQTPYAGDADGAWMVDFGSGYVFWSNRANGGYYVRPVRQY